MFFQTGNLLSENNLFNVNNIKLEKKDKKSNKEYANQAIKRGFNQLISKILLQEDNKKLTDLKFSSIKQLVTFYQISDIIDKENGKEYVNFSVTFDKNKIHKLFYQRGISYSEILDKELFVLPLLIKNDEILVFNNNYFYKNWNNFYENDLIEFILPLENIEIIQNIRKNNNNLINLLLEDIFKEYSSKNLALILIEENKDIIENVYFKTKIQGKNISKGLDFKKESSKSKKLYEKIIIESKKELINLVKSKNLIDIRTPAFLNAKLKLSKNNFVEFSSRIEKIDLIESINVQEFNKDYMNLRIRYLGKLEKIINQLKMENINLRLQNDYWIIQVL